MNTFHNLSDVQLSAYIQVTSDKIISIVESFVPDIIHCQHIWLQPSAICRLSIPFVISAQGTDQMGYRSNPRFRSSAQSAAAGAGRIIAASEYIRKEVIETFAGAEGKTETVLSAINTSAYENQEGSRELALSRLGLPGGVGPLVAFLGKFVPFKGPDLMVEAARIYSSSEKNISTVLCGDGPLRPALQRAAEEITPSRIWFLGDRPIGDRAALLNIADVVAMPSRQEPFGLVALEAMASGTPVLATHAGGLPEIVNDQTGMLIEPNNPDALAQGVLRAVSEGWKASKGRAAREYVRSRHDWNTWGAELEQVYRDVIDAQR
jgi:glycosyltransferase involved in cell wall biosynthesis